MIWFWLFIGIVGILFLVFDLITLDSRSDEVGFSIFVGILITLVACLGLWHAGNVKWSNRHNTILRNLQAEGWRVQSNDVHVHSGMVDIGCVHLKVKKLGDTYQVVVKRDNSLGGGYRVLQSDRQDSFEKGCL